jgi:hypothetical protein
MGLWAFDLAEVELMQNDIDEDKRGIVNATERAFMNVAFVFILFMGVVLSDPSYFPILMIISYDAVLLGVILYSIYFFFLRKKKNVSKAPEAEKEVEIHEISNQYTKQTDDVDDQMNEIQGKLEPE